MRALWDYSPTSTEDLTFKAGDIIQIIGPSSLGNWWWHGWIEGKGIGTFPFNFVEPLEDDPDHSEDEELPLHSKPISKCLVRFRVLKDVESLEEGMLSLKQGDIIDLVERQTTERWLGRLKSQVGTFLLDESVVRFFDLHWSTTTDLHIVGADHDRSCQGALRLHRYKSRRT